MSTRATYKLTEKSERRNLSVTCYIHHDGYPDGGAYYLWNAFRAMEAGSKGGLITSFIRANDGAELTNGHTEHSDTEYRYDIVQDGYGVDNVTVRVSKRDIDGNEWSGCWIGSLVNFLNTHTRLSGQEGFTELKKVDHGYRTGHWMNATMAKHAIENPLSSLEIWSKNGVMSPQACNWTNCVRECEQLLNAFPELVAEYFPRLGSAQVTLQETWEAKQREKAQV